MSEPLTHQFFVDGDGKVHETSVFEAVSRLAELFPEVNPSALEAELMLERCHRLLALERDTQWAPYGLTGSRFILLRMLHSTQGGRLSMGHIAAQMNLEPNNVTQLVDSMVRQGLVRRQPAEDDKRVIYATLTQEGEELFTQVMSEGAARIERAFSVLNQREQQALSSLLSKVRMNLLTDASRLEDEDHSSDHNRAGGDASVPAGRQGLKRSDGRSRNSTRGKAREDGSS